jgi:hypothetical protein
MCCKIQISISGKGKRLSRLRIVQTGTGHTQPHIQYVPAVIFMGVAGAGAVAGGVKGARN